MKKEKLVILVGVVLLHVAYYAAWVAHMKGVI